jgi:hypothetical protein
MNECNDCRHGNVILLHPNRPGRITHDASVEVIATSTIADPKQRVFGIFVQS